MRPETAVIVDQIQGLRHEASHGLIVALLRGRLEQNRSQLVTAPSHLYAQLQGRAQECETLLQYMVDGRVRGGLPGLNSL